MFYLASLFVIVAVIIFQVRYLYSPPPSVAFKRILGSDILPSVKNIHSDNSYGGMDSIHFLRFEIAPEDLQKLIFLKGFKQDNIPIFRDSVPSWWDEWWEIINPIFYRLRIDVDNDIYMIVDPEKNIVYVAKVKC
jgi:hypothetical protein